MNPRNIYNTHRKDSMKKETIYKIFSNIPTLHTERLTLRALRALDAEDMYEYARDPEVTKYLLWSEHKSLAFTREYLEYIESRYALGDFYDWAIVLSDTGKMIGTCGFTKIDTVNHSAEIGYVLNPAYHRMGIAPEAAAEVMRFGYEELSLHRIEARFMEGNDASRTVMERLGMSFEGFERDSVFVKGGYATVGKYAKLASDK